MSKQDKVRNDLLNQLFEDTVADIATATSWQTPTDDYYKRLILTQRMLMEEKKAKTEKKKAIGEILRSVGTGVAGVCSLVATILSLSYAKDSLDTCLKFEQTGSFSSHSVRIADSITKFFKK